jgi:hypothetical protein
MIKEDTTYTSSVTNKSYPIIGHNTCKTKNTLYQLECKLNSPNNTKKCQAFYVGKTEQELRGRMNGHRATVLHQELDHPVANHANTIHNTNDFNSCYSVKPIRAVKSNNPLDLDMMERATIRVLQARQTAGQPGLNLRA